MKLKLLTILLAATAFGTACGDDDDTTGPVGEANVRIVHIAPQVGDIDLLLDGNVIEEDIPYAFGTAYEEVGGGDRNVQVRVTGSTTAIIEGDVALNDGSSHTLVVAGPLDELEVGVLEDDLDPPSGGAAKLRLIHGAPGAGAVDIYVTQPDVPLEFENPDFEGSFGDFLEDYTEVEEGDYQVRVTPAGSLTPVVDKPLTLGSGNIKTAIVVEAATGGAPYDVLVLEDTN
jgi:hypothetical protein